MAVSFRLAIFLIAILVFAVVWGVGAEMVEVIEPIADNQTATQDGNDLYTWVSTIWGLLPVFAVFAMAAWLLKQAVVVQR